MKKLLIYSVSYIAFACSVAQNNIPLTSINTIEVKIEKPKKELLAEINEPVNKKTYEKDPINVQHFVLKNGLTVMLSENHDLPQVFGMVVVKAGGKNDPSDATGLAHYLEHMLFKGTQTMGTVDYEKEKPYLDKINDLYEELGKTTDIEQRKLIQKKINEQSILAGEYAIANEMDKILAEIGGTGVNAFTTEDMTAYHNTFPSNQIEKWIEIYSHRFQNPVFRLFQSELETVYEEKNRSNDNAFGQVFETFLKHFWKNHPYGQQPVIGHTEHLKNPPIKKMYEYFEKHYVANNMALVLAGDFKTSEILPLIEAKFGVWRTGKIEKFPEYPETEFKGREYVEVKMTPVKAGLIGFRAPSAKSEEKAVIEVCNNLLSNAEQSGLLDMLAVEGKVMTAGLFHLPYNDYGANLVFFVPKIIGQKLEDAEKIVLNEFEKIKKGEFDETMLQAVKLNLKKQISMGWETNEERVMEMAAAFSEGKDWGEYVGYAEKINNVSTQDVINAANKYFGSNFLCLYSKMGFPKKEKLDKPGFEPVIPKNEVKSEFRKEFEKIPSSKSEVRFVEFNKDIQSEILTEKITLNMVKNPYNDIFSMEIQYGTGKYYNQVLRYCPSYLSMIGTKEKTAKDFKKEFYQLGCTYSFEVTDEKFIVRLDGLEENLDKALILLSQFINSPQEDDKKVKKMLDDIEGEKKISRREPSHIAQALQEYALYGSESDFRKELTAAQLKKLKASELINAFFEAQKFEVVINYSGKKSLSDIKPLILNTLKQPEFTTQKPVVKDVKNINENTIYIVDKKSAVQSQIWFNISGKEYNNEEEPVADAFNSYFGADMSSLVFQEIREFRSLAYSTRANYISPRIKGKNNLFKGYVGCQGDKTNDALAAMNDLIRNMPEKPERIESIKSALIEKSQSSRPSFRNLAQVVENYKLKGYNADPNSIKISKYSEIKFDDIVAFYSNEIKSKPVLITLVGDGKRFNKSELEKYGKIVEVKEKELFVN